MVLYEIAEPHIAKITLNRPDRRNAIRYPDMWAELDRKIAMAEDDDSVKCIVLAGNGTQFCAGEDVTKTPVEALGLKKGEKLPQSVRMRRMSSGARGKPDFLYSDKTIIAAVQGSAYGLGFLIALSCDIIVAADDARFARRQTRIGFAGFDMILPVILMKLGINRGYEVLITGRSVAAQELEAWGAVASCVPGDQLLDEAMRYAKAVAHHSTDGLMLGRMAKKLFWDSVGIPQWQEFVSVAHPLFTNLVWRDDEVNLFKERARTGSARAALDAVHQRWTDLGFD
jgi:enoyl-CoA hydratase